MVKKRISTLIDGELWKEAQFKDIRWTEALELGVKIMTQSKDEIPDLEEDIKQKTLEIEYARKKIETLKQKEKEKEIESDSRIIMKWDIDPETGKRKRVI